MQTAILHNINRYWYFSNANSYITQYLSLMVFLNANSKLHNINRYWYF